MTFTKILTAIIVSCVAAVVLAHMRGPGPMGEAAATACSGKAIGDQTTLKSFDHTTPIPATCQLVAIPNPPAQAIDACRDKAVGDTVSFTLTIHGQSQTIEGICKTIHHQLAAVPAYPHRGHMMDDRGPRH